MHIIISTLSVLYRDHQSIYLRRALVLTHHKRRISQAFEREQERFRDYRAPAEVGTEKAGHVLAAGGQKHISLGDVKQLQQDPSIALHVLYPRVPLLVGSH
jgi:hypothetical protein